MATAYPGALDDFTNPTASDTLNSNTVPHATQHADANDAIEAIEATLGTNPEGGEATVSDRIGALETGLGLSPFGGDLALNIGQVTAAAADELVAGTDPGEVDDDAPVTWFKFTIDGTDYGIPAYAIVPA